LWRVRQLKTSVVSGECNISTLSGEVLPAKNVMNLNRGIKFMPKVLISDKMNPLAAEIFERNKIEVDVKTGLSPEELLEIIGDYDGLAVRSSTTATKEMLAAAKNLKVIGRAGIGVDNIDVPAATQAGIIVMNTPFGNSITTAEHAIAMMFAVARDIPQASASTHAGKWEKSKFMGVELFGKKLGIIGCGNIGQIVASRALGLQMHVMAFDPFLSAEQAEEHGIEKVELDKLLAEADFISIHTPLNDKTRGLINKDSIAKMKKGVRIINCARGGIINEADLKEALDSGHVAGAALDVFEVEPAKENVLFGHEKVVCTPHLGASTSEAQVNVAIQVAEQISDFLNNGAVTNALNTPSISAEDAPKLKPYMKLAEQLGSLAGQITGSSIREVNIEYEGTVAELNTVPLKSILMANLLKHQLDSVNMVNALSVAESRNIEISDTYKGSSKDWRSLITLRVTTEKSQHIVAGTLFTGKEPRVVNIESVPIEAALSEHMLFIRNDDTPGLVGKVGTLLGDNGHNIADFRLGRVEGRTDGDAAVALISLDAPLPDDLFNEISNLPQIVNVKRLSF
jgi:D-3-phosphoglycerate dehydrogenase